MTRKMRTNGNHDYASSSSKRIKTCDNDVVRRLSDLNHDVLSLVIMQLEIVDFLAFSRVCKSWRSVALRNEKRFMASKPPMLMRISPSGNNDMECCLEDYEGRKLKTILSYCFGKSFVGLTCGYLIFFNLKINDFWLLNPITRNELYFPPAPCVFSGVGEPSVTCVLVFSLSISRFVFVMLDRGEKQIWFSIAGGGPWKRVSTHCFMDLLVCKRKIYTRSEGGHLYELTLSPKPELTLFKTKNLSDEDLISSDLVSSGEDLYVLKRFSQGDKSKVRKLDFGKMEWEPFDDTRDEDAFFLTYLKYRVAKPESWAGSWLKYWRRRSNRGDRFSTAKQWYFPHECLNANILDES